MNLATLDRFDVRSANGVLAAAALLTNPVPFDDASSLTNEFATQAQELISEIRENLNIARSDNSPRARTLVDKTIAIELRNRTVGALLDDALSRAGQSGKLPTSMYVVEQPESFSRRFQPLGVRKGNVEEAVRFPDDYQHLMNDSPLGVIESDVISLFVKRVEGTVGGDFWLLVQTHRIGQRQVAQSAWRIYPDEVPLEGARNPLDLLKRFASVFGVPVKARSDSKETMFLEAEVVPAQNQLEIFVRKVPDFFASVSKVNLNDPTKMLIGTGYGIDMAKYRSALKLRGVKIA